MSIRIVRFLSVLAILSLNGLALASPADVISAPNTYDVFMILWRGETEVEQGFRSYITEHQLPFRLTVRSADGDSSLLRKYISEAKALRPDLVYTWGTPATLAAVGQFDQIDPDLHITGIPVVFTMVSYPVGAGIVPSMNSSGRNVTGTVQTVPVDSEIKAIMAYRALKKLAIIYNPAEPNATLKVEELREAAAQNGFELIARKVPLDTQGEPRSELLPKMIREIVAQDPQFLYLGPDTFLAKHADLVTTLAIEERLPSFAGVEFVLCNSHALFGLFARYFSLGKLTAFKAQQILIDRKSPEDIPIESVSQFSYIINQNVVLQLKLYPPMRVLEYAHVVQSCGELDQ